METIKPKVYRYTVWRGLMEDYRAQYAFRIRYSGRYKGDLVI